MGFSRSQQLYEEAQKLLPGGVSSPVRAFRAVGGGPLFIQRGLGARIWDVDSGSMVAALPHDGVVLYARFSADGRRVVTTTGLPKSRAWVWDAVTGNQLLELCCFEDEVRYADFTPDGRRLFTMSYAGVDVWRVANGAKVATIRSRDGATLAYAALSASGNHIVTVTSNTLSRGFETATSPTAPLVNKVRLWITSSGAELASLSGHKDSVLHAVFSPDGRRVVTASRDGRARVFEVFPSTQELIDYAKQIVPRRLSPCEEARFFLLSGDAQRCP